MTETNLTEGQVLTLQNYFGMESAANEANRLVLNLVLIHRPYLDQTDEWLCFQCSDTWPCQTLQILHHNAISNEAFFEILGDE